MGNSVLETGPTKEPITLSEAKAHLRFDSTDDDALIRGLIVSAREWVENFTGRALFTQSWSYYLDGFYDEINLPFPELQSVTTITYTDADGATQTLATSVYDVDTFHKPGRVLLGYSQSWPTTQSVRNAVRIQYVAGYSAVADIPEAIKSAIKIMVGHWYENREPVIIGTISGSIPMSAESLLYPYRTKEF